MKPAAAGLLALLAAAAAATAGELDAEVERLAVKHGVDSAAAAGVCAMRVESGEVLVARRADEAFPLASVTKLYTAAAALEVLGPAHAFTTRVWIRPCRCGGADRDHAQLVVAGEGEPGISGRDHGGNPCAVFERWAALIKAAGYAKVCRIALDETRFDAVHVAPGWPKDQLAQWYSAPCGALALNDGCVDVTVAPGEAGKPAKVTLSPDTAWVSIDNRCTTTASKAEHVVSFTRKPGTNRIVVGGRFYVKASPWTESVTVEDPAMYFGTVLRETLDRCGVASKEAALERLAAPFEPPEELGPPLVSRTDLPDALRVMLRRSQNFYAEQTLRALGPRGGTFEDCTAAGLRALAPLGVKPADLQWLDGSGLTRGNRAAPAAVVRFLAGASRRPSFPDLHASMAAPGDEGTLQKRFPGLEKSLRAKTGTIAGVSNLAGYVDSPKGRVAFAILISQLKAGSAPAQAFQEDVVRLLAK
ncbi:MAG: D-alanyl-D-alanine carboxypeptidase/D-alanyl-D-alanine-endopeptidase [Planctomycetes bacterium]|nr:D-alanyl-D-alanine carboxypeptidase/D-alanyl-D-alanine-endopeptidase [Planctomycetota bacterium]